MQRLTDRQFVALYLYYVCGQSHRKIGRVLGVDRKTVYEHLRSARNKLITIKVETPYPRTLPLVERLLEPSPTASVTRGAGIAASRREDLLDALERRMAQRDAELADISECMSGDSFSPTHALRNTYDQWEARYLSRHAGEPLPTSAYDAGHAAANCACDAPSCTLGCAGCRHGTN